MLATADVSEHQRYGRRNPPTHPVSQDRRFSRRFFVWEIEIVSHLRWRYRYKQFYELVGPFHINTIAVSCEMKFFCQIMTLSSNTL